jgi:formate hydrogenlyase subunit 3/multisubunit Na+/H+ antiporter MnhD subunit
MNAQALLASLCWPILLALGLGLAASRGMARALAPWAALPALLAGLAAAAATELEIGWLMLGGRLGLDSIATVMLPVTAGLWLAAGLFAQRYLDAGPRRDVFFAWFLAAMAGNLLLLAALDAIVFYLGFALMSFASYGLVVHRGDARARHAGRYYIVLVVIGEVCIVAALMLLASGNGIDFVSLRAGFPGATGRGDLVTGLLVVGFGIKAGVFGLHFWLPLAHPVAPAPASAVLSGAMIKAGLIAWMRLLPLGDTALPAWGAGLAVAGLVTAGYGVLAGLPQREAKTVLAYSSISQMGLMTLAIGLGLAFPGQWQALSATLLVFMAHHALVKGSLFLGAGLVQHPLGPVAARVVGVVLSAGAFAIAGGAVTGGLVAKQALKQAAGGIAGPWGAVVPSLLSLSSVLTALLMARFLWIAWPRPSAGAKRLPASLLAPWLALFGASLAVPWVLAAPPLRAAAAGLHAAWGGSWPVLLAGAIAFAAVGLRRAGRVPALPVVPPGDLGIPLERGVVYAGQALGRFLDQGLPRTLDVFRGAFASVIRTGPGWSDRLGRGEARIAAWSMTAALLLLVAAAFAWLMG